jgi:hypothetical protein
MSPVAKEEIHARVLLTTLGLLAVAASASAECARVMWLMNVGPSNTHRWTVYDAFISESRCRAERERVMSSGTMPPETMLQCLPDTVDPRGPKGK